MCASTSATRQHFSQQMVHRFRKEVANGEIKVQSACALNTVYYRNIKEVLKRIPLHGKTTGENVFQGFYARLLEMYVPIYINLCQSTQMALQP
jgi:hypothetical protein